MHVFPTSCLLLSVFLAAFSSIPVVAASSKEDFPLTWVCLGITVGGIILAFYIAARRPEEEVPVPQKGIQVESNTESSAESFDGRELNELSKVASLSEPTFEDVYLNGSF